MKILEKYFLDKFCLKFKRLDQILPIHKQMFEILTRVKAMRAQRGCQKGHLPGNLELITYLYAVIRVISTVK